MNLIIFVCAVLGTLIAIITYQQTIYGKAKEKRKYLLDEFNFIKNLNSQLLARLNDYVIKNHCAHSLFLENQTFLEYIDLLNKLERFLDTPEFEKSLKKNAKYLTGSDINTNNLIKDVEYWQVTLFSIHAALNKLTV